jgi:signal transduction histidine kinase
VPFALRFDDTDAGGALTTWFVMALHLTLAAVLGDRMRGRAREREGLHERARMLAVERDQQAAIATAAERARIAREMHDVVAHSLSVVIAQADGGRYAAEHDPGAARAALRTIGRSAREAQAEMRRALGVLGERPDEPLRPQPGVGDLDALVARTREAGLPVELVEEGERRALTAATGLAVYRVVQEALTNVLKHAGPGAAAEVRLGWEEERVTVLVRDDGIGAAHRSGEDGSGRGLAGMRERTESRGGEFSAGPAPGGGFEVRATIPTESARAEVRS